MKGKRYTTEEKIRMLRQADKGKTILEVCRENNISEQTFHRWKRELGMIDVNQAKRMKNSLRKNAGLKRKLTDKLLGIEILQETLEKKWKMSLALGSKPWAQAASGGSYWPTWARLMSSRSKRAAIVTITLYPWNC